jgi:hypothetical protein
MSIALFQKRRSLGHGLHHRLERVDIIGKGGIVGRHRAQHSTAGPLIEAALQL